MFIDEFSSFQLRLFMRLLGLADRHGNVKIGKRALVNKLAWIEDFDGSRIDARTIHIHKALNYFALEGVVKRNFTTRTPQAQDREYRWPIVIEPKYFVLARIDQQAETALRDKVERLDVEVDTLKKRNETLRNNNKTLKAFRTAHVQKVAVEHDPLKHFGGETKRGQMYKVIIAWLVIIGIDEYFYEGNDAGAEKLGVQPMYSLFNRWISHSKFNTVVAVLQQLAPYNVKAKVCDEGFSFEKNQSAVHAYMFGAMRKGSARGVSSSKRYGRSTSREGKSK